MVKRILVLAAAAAAMAACADSPTAPSQARATSAQRSNDITCRGGYVVAYDELGNPYCAPVEGGTQTMTRQP